MGILSLRQVAWLPTALALVLGGVTEAAATEQVLVWAVVPVSAADEALATWARTDLELQVRKLAGFTTVKPEPVRQIVADEYPDLVDCLAEVTCLCEIGAIAAADIVLVGTLAKLGDHWSVTLRAVRVAKRTATVAVSEAVAGNEEAISARLGEILPQALVAPIEALPEVAVASPAGATGLAWAKWSATGGAGLAAAGALTFGLLTVRKSSQQTELCPRRQCPSVTALAEARALGRDGERQRTWTNVMLVATGVLSATAATLFLLDGGGGEER